MGAAPAAPGGQEQGGLTRAGCGHLTAAPYRVDGVTGRPLAVTLCELCFERNMARRMRPHTPYTLDGGRREYFPSGGVPAEGER